MNKFLGIGGAIARLALDGALARHQAIASNIANADTPDYVPIKVSFEDQLATAGRTGNVSNVRLSPVIEQDYSNPGVTPSVALDMEIVKLNMNTLYYNSMLKATSRYLSISSIAVSEGRK